MFISQLLGTIGFSKRYIDVFVYIAVPLLPQSKVGRLQGDYTQAKGVTANCTGTGITKGTLALFTGRTMSEETKSQEEWVSLNANIELFGNSKRVFKINLFPIPQ